MARGKEEGTVKDIDRAGGTFKVTNRGNNQPELELKIRYLRGVTIEDGDRIEFKVDNSNPNNPYYKDFRNLSHQQGGAQQQSGQQASKTKEKAGVTVGQWLFGQPKDVAGSISFAVHIPVQRGNQPANDVSCTLSVNGTPVTTPLANPRPSNGLVYFKVLLPSGITEADLAFTATENNGKTFQFAQSWEAPKQTEAEVNFLDVQFLRYVKPGRAKFRSETKVDEAAKDRKAAELVLTSDDEVVPFLNGTRLIKGTHRDLVATTGLDDIEIELPTSVCNAEITIRLKNGKGKAFRFLIER